MSAEDIRQTKSMLDNADELPDGCVWWTCMIAVSSSGIDDEADHLILFLHKEESCKDACSRPKAQNLQAPQQEKGSPNQQRLSERLHLGDP